MSWRRPLIVLLALCSVLVPSPGVSALVSHGYFCKACAVLMEEAHAELFRELKATAVPDRDSKFRLDVTKTVRRVCESPFILGHTEPIRDGCREIATKNAGVVAEALKGFNWRGRGQAEPSQVYHAIEDACVTKMDLCAGSYCMVPPCEDWRPVSRCDSCKAVMQDIQDTLIRRRGGRGYLTRKHVWDVLEGTCRLGLFMRHPKAIADSMAETCDELLDEFEEQLGSVFVRSDPSNPPPHALRTICGPSVSGMCNEDGLDAEGGDTGVLAAKKATPQLNGDWDAWRSPWSHVSYVEAAKVLQETWWKDPPGEAGSELEGVDGQDSSKDRPATAEGGKSGRGKKKTTTKKKRRRQSREL